MRYYPLVPLLAGATAHLVYNRFEPRRLLSHFFILILVPISLAVLLNTQTTRFAWVALNVWSTYLCALVTSLLAYRLSPFHPLAKYPGPLGYKVSKIWFTRDALAGKQYKIHQDLHRRYGDVVRIGPNELSFCTPDVILPMLGPNGMTKAAYWDGRYSDQQEFRSLIGLRDPRAHALLRRVWSRAFTPEALRAYQPILQRRVDQLLEHLGARTGKSIDLARWISWFSYDVMNDMAFGDKMELMQNEDAKGIWNVMEDAQPNALLLGHLPWLAKFAIQIPGAAKKIKKFREFSRRRVMRRYKEGSGQKDLLYHLMDEGGIDAEPPAMNQVASDASLIIIAGSDTVSPSLSSLFYYLISNPLAYARLQTEIDESKLSAEDVQGLSKLRYLNAVINETMRLIPPLLDGSMRSPLIGSGGHMLGEHHIPEGTTTNLHMFTLHRDHRNFSPSPDKFLPERWLPADDQVALEPDIFKNRKSIIHNIAAFIPFSYGPADCIGKQMAMREMRWVVVAILKRFKMRFADGYDPAIWEDEIRDYFVIKKPKLSIVMTERA